MFEEDALIGLDAVESALEQAGDGDIGSVSSVVVEASVALGADADLQVGLAGAGDENAKVRRHQHVGVLAGDVAGFERAAVERRSSARSISVGDGAVAGEVDGRRRTELQRAAARELMLAVLSPAVIAPLLPMTAPPVDLERARNSDAFSADVPIGWELGMLR